MIKFFRRIRQQLLSKDKFSKYLLYAIGEIILVVIGILIALSINNWNEIKKQRLEADTHINNMVDYIYENVRNTYDVYAMQSTDSVLHYIINKDTLGYNKVTNLRNTKKNPINFFLNNSEFEWNENFDIVLENQKIYPESYSKIISILRNMKAIQDGFIKPSEVILDEMSKKNKDIMMDSFEWFPFNDEKSQKERINYYMTDFKFYNRLYEYRREHNTWAGQSLRLRALKIQLLSELKNKNLIETSSSLKEIFEGFSMEKLEVLACDVKEKTDDGIHNYLFWNLIINKSSDTLFFSRIQRNNEFFPEHLLPGESDIISSRKSGPIYILENGECSKKLITKINGYYIHD